MWGVERSGMACWGENERWRGASRMAIRIRRLEVEDDIIWLR